MKTCKSCKSEHLVEVNAKCSDCCQLYYSKTDISKLGYVPDTLKIGGGDYIQFTYCLNCGQIQDEFPVGEKDINDIFEEETE